MHDLNEPTRSPSVRILLADDHAVVRAGIRQFIERAGDLQVIAEAEDGQAASDLVDQLQPDVIVLDIQMPRMSGIEVTRRVHARYPKTGILILTAYDDDPFISAVLKAGANGYVLKTSPPDEIIRAIREVHAGRPALDPGIARKLLSQFSAQEVPPSIEALTEREKEVLELAGRGFTNKAIGHQLGISDRTVQNHLARIFEKLQAASRTEAVMRAVSLGWLPATLGEIPDR